MSSKLERIRQLRARRKARILGGMESHQFCSLVDGELVWGLVWYAPVTFCLDGVVRPMVESGEVGTGLVWKGLLF